jgi:hypothetical protein
VTYGGDLGNRIFVLYWRCPLIRVSVIRGSTVYGKECGIGHAETDERIKETLIHTPDETLKQ